MSSERHAHDFAHSTLDVQEAHLERSARRWTLVLRIVFLTLAALVWAAFSADAAHGLRATVDAVAERDANLATAVEHYMVRVLRSARAVHSYVGITLAEGRSEEDVVGVLRDRLRANDAFRELGLCLPDGRVLPPPAPGALLTAATCESIAAAATSTKEVTVLPPLGTHGHLLLPLTLELRDANGARRAVAVGLVPAGKLLGIMQAAVLRSRTAVLVSGADGSPRAGWRSEGGHVMDAADFGTLAALQRASGGDAMIGGRRFFVSGRAMPQAPLQIRVATDSEDALAAFTSRRARLAFLCLAITFGLGLVYRLLSRMHDEGIARSQALSRAHADLQALNEHLDREVQARTAQLENAYRDLETFSYAVAHDVRAPIASIAGFAKALEPAVAALPGDKPAHYLRRIQSNAADMEELTTHLLELGRLTRAPLAPSPLDVSSLAGEVVSRLRESAPHRSVEVAIEAGLAAHADRALMRQVLENLLGNAWKFTSRQALARIDVRRAAEAAHPAETVFVVEDNGDGFDSDQAPGLFQPFRRLHAAGEFPGTGVGLAAVKRIVALHGGRVWCQSRPRAGARFYVAIPRPV